MYSPLPRLPTFGSRSWRVLCEPRTFVYLARSSHVSFVYVLCVLLVNKAVVLIYVSICISIAAKTITVSHTHASQYVTSANYCQIIYS